MPPQPESLPARLPGRAWAVMVLCFLGAYGLLFAYVHPHADTRACIAQLSDPLFPLIPWDSRWYFVSHTVYYVFNAAGTGSLLYLAIRRRDQRPFVRFVLALGLQALLRSVTVLMLPLCKATIAPGTAALTSVPMLNLGFAHIPWRMWATNDLVFSGHVGEFLLLMWAATHWPRPARVALIVFQVLQAYALLATRGHYTVDIVLAIPCAYFADGMALWLLGKLAPARRSV